MAIVEIMGPRSLLVGLRPGVVSALIDMDADVEGLETAIDLDAAFRAPRADGWEVGRYGGGP